MPFVLVATLFGGTVTAQTQLTTDQAIAKTTASIQLQIQLLKRGIGEVSGVAALFTNRGKLYLYETDKLADAESDFLDALKMLKSPPPKDKESRQAWHQATGDAFLFLAQSQCKLGRASKAVDSASSALTAYSSMIADGVETAEPLTASHPSQNVSLAQFLIGIDTLDTFDEGKRKQAFDEADLALGYLKKSAAKADGKFFASERVLLIAAKDKLAQRSNVPRRSAERKMP